MIPEIKVASDAKPRMNAVSLRSLLGSLLFITILAGIGLYYLGFKNLETYAVAVNHRVVDADASSKQIQGLQALKSQIDQDEQLIAKADAIFASQDTYQTQAVKDVQRYAALSGLTISSTSFNETSLSSAHSFSVNINSTVSYKSLLMFLTAVESNVPKLQVTQLSIKRTATGGDTVNVTNVAMTILVR